MSRYCKWCGGNSNGRTTKDALGCLCYSKPKDMLGAVAVLTGIYMKMMKDWGYTKSDVLSFLTPDKISGAWSIANKEQQ